LTSPLFPSYIVFSEGVETPALEIAKHAANNVLLYRFLKSIVRFYEIKRDPQQHGKIAHRLREVIDSAGMIS
jgi:hypothetical protein